MHSDNSTSYTARLAELGIELPRTAPLPVGSYVPAVASGSFIYTAGQLPLIEGALVHAGVVGDAVSVQDATACARICAVNAISAIARELGSLERVTRIVKLVGFVASAPGFSEQAAVLNGASDLVGQIFGAAGIHARSAVGVAALPLGAPVEVEIVAEVA